MTVPGGSRLAGVRVNAVSAASAEGSGRRQTLAEATDIEMRHDRRGVVGRIAEAHRLGPDELLRECRAVRSKERVVRPGIGPPLRPLGPVVERNPDGVIPPGATDLA